MQSFANRVVLITGAGSGLELPWPAAWPPKAPLLPLSIAAAEPLAGTGQAMPRLGLGCRRRDESSGSQSGYC